MKTPPYRWLLTHSPVEKTTRAQRKAYSSGCTCRCRKSEPLETMCWCSSWNLGKKYQILSRSSSVLQNHLQQPVHTSKQSSALVQSIAWY